MTPFQFISNRLDAIVWGNPDKRLPRWQSSLIWLARLIYALGRDLTSGSLSLHATSLVYTTLLSLVPLLAVSFSVLKGFGVHNELEPLLLNALRPLGESGTEIASRIIGFVDNMRVGVLGSVGLAILLYVVVSLIQKIEQVFNATWRVSEHRGFAQRFSQYLSVLLVGPVLFFSAVGLSAALTRYIDTQALLAAPGAAILMAAAGQLAPYLLIVLAFTVIYLFVPNTRVRLGSAVIGALAAGLLWKLVGAGFSAVMVGSTQYTAVYSSLAILMLFMIWIQIGWSILLIGASVAFYHQHPEYLTTRAPDLVLSHRLRERLSLLATARIARRFAAGEPAWTCHELARSLGIPPGNTQHILSTLERAGVLLRTAHEDPGYLPARSPETFRVKALLEAVRTAEERNGGFVDRNPDAGIRRIEQALEAATDGVLEDMTISDLADAIED